MVCTLSLADAEATRDLGRRLGASAHEGAVLALSGELGAGKTTLTQGLGQALGVDGPVTSPTFQLLFVHPGRLPLYHADLYRLGDDSELTELGFDELLGQLGVSVIEWADRFPEILLDDHLEARLGYAGDARRVTLEAHGPRSRGWLEQALGRDS